MKLYNESCRVCKHTIATCKCPQGELPCPFCERIFGFTQDWNIHLQKDHKKEMEKYD